MAIVELTLEVDPFASLVPITSVRTVDDLCAAYAQCFTDAPAATGSAATVTTAHPQSPLSRPRPEGARPLGPKDNDRSQQRALRRHARGEGS